MADVVVSRGRFYVSPILLGTLAALATSFLVGRSELAALETKQKDTAADVAENRRNLATKEEVALLRQDLRDYRAEVMVLYQAMVKAQEQSGRHR